MTASEASQLVSLGSTATSELLPAWQEHPNSCPGKARVSLGIAWVWKSFLVDAITLILLHEALPKVHLNIYTKGLHLCPSPHALFILGVPVLLLNASSQPFSPKHAWAPNPKGPVSRSWAEAALAVSLLCRMPRESLVRAY